MLATLLLLASVARATYAFTPTPGLAPLHRHLRPEQIQHGSRRFRLRSSRQTTVHEERRERKVGCSLLQHSATVISKVPPALIAQSRAHGSSSTSVILSGISGSNSPGDRPMSEGKRDIKQSASTLEDTEAAADTNLAEDSEPLSVQSATSLVAGTTVGAGILALPAFCVKAGFIPSSLALIGSWVYMVITGLLIAEVSLNMAKSHKPDGGLISMASRTVGFSGAAVSGFAYLFLHYAMLVAYITEAGDLLTESVEGLGLTDLPRQLAPVLFTGLFGSAMAFGNKKTLDKANDAMVGLVVASFLALLVVTLPHADLTSLSQANWPAAISILPILFVALVFHNVVPVISYRLQGNPSSIRTSIILGTVIPLIMFISWNAVTIGSIGAANPAAVGSSELIDPLQILMKGGAGDTVGKLVSVFSELAIITSLTGFVYGRFVAKGDQLPTQILPFR